MNLQEKCQKGSSLLRTEVSKNANKIARNILKLSLENEDNLLGERGHKVN